MLDEKRLSEIEARANAATPGPWFPAGNANGYWVECGEKGEDGERNQWIANIDSAVKHERPDAAFIADARQDIPELLAEVRRLRAALTDYANHADDSGWSNLAREIRRHVQPARQNAG